MTPVLTDPRTCLEVRSYTFAEAAKLCNVSLIHFRKLVEAGAVKTVSFGMPTNTTRAAERISFLEMRRLMEHGVSGCPAPYTQA